MIKWRRGIVEEEVEGRKERGGLLIEKGQDWHLLYSAKRLYFPPERRPNFQPEVRHHSEKLTGFWGRGGPRKRWNIGGIARIARLQSSASSLLECQPERGETGSELTITVLARRPSSHAGRVSGGRCPSRQRRAVACASESAFPPGVRRK